MHISQVREDTHTNTYASHMVTFTFQLHVLLLPSFIKIIYILNIYYTCNKNYIYPVRFLLGMHRELFELRAYEQVSTHQFLCIHVCIVLNCLIDADCAFSNRCTSKNASGATCALLCVPVATGLTVSLLPLFVMMCVDCKTTTRQATTTLAGNSFSRNYILFFPFLAQSEHVLVDADCTSNDMQICQSRWQDVCFVVWTSYNRDASCSIQRVTAVAHR
jgi:hypothetical protein